MSLWLKGVALSSVAVSPPGVELSPYTLQSLLWLHGCPSVFPLSVLWPLMLTVLPESRTLGWCDEVKGAKKIWQKQLGSIREHYQECQRPQRWRNCQNEESIGEEQKRFIKVKCRGKLHCLLYTYKIIIGNWVQCVNK